MREMGWAKLGFRRQGVASRFKVLIELGVGRSQLDRADPARHFVEVSQTNLVVLASVPMNKLDALQEVEVLPIAGSVMLRLSLFRLTSFTLSAAGVVVAEGFSPSG
jgi:hypothetical protein